MSIEQLFSKNRLPKRILFIASEMSETEIALTKKIILFGKILTCIYNEAITY